MKVSISCALFVPKAQTPFQWDGQITTEEAHRRINLLRSSVKYRAVDVHWHEPDVSLVEAMMSRGGREVCDVVETAWRHARALTHGPSFSRLIRGERRVQNAALIWKASPKVNTKRAGLHRGTTFQLA